MRNLLKTRSIFLLAIILTISCKKKEINNSNNNVGEEIDKYECHPFVYNDPFITQNVQRTGPQFMMPCFNPNNGDEFVYVKKMNPVQLVKHSISTGEEFVLCSNLYISSQPQWGKQDWIIFGSAFPQIIYKIKSDGTQLTALSTPSQEYNSPLFNSEGNKYIQFGTVDLLHHLTVFNLNGVKIDTINGNFNNKIFGRKGVYNSDFNNGYGFYADYNTADVFGIAHKISSDSLILLNNFHFSEGAPHALCKNNDNVYYVRFTNGLYSFNLNTNQETKLMDNCDSKYIETLSMSPDGKNIIYERVRGKQLTPGGGGIDEQSEIFIYNVDTKKETKILWEE